MTLITVINQILHNCFPKKGEEASLKILLLLLANNTLLLIKYVS